MLQIANRVDRARVRDLAVYSLAIVMTALAVVMVLGLLGPGIRQMLSNIGGGLG
jgi:hypothetical protein